MALHIKPNQSITVTGSYNASKPTANPITPAATPLATAMLEEAPLGVAVPDGVAGDVGVYCGRVVESTAVVAAMLIVAVPSSTVKYVPAMALSKPESVLYLARLLNRVYYIN